MTNFILAAATVLLVAVTVASAGDTQTCTVQGPSLVTPFQGGDPYRLAMPCRYQLTDFYVPFETHRCRPRIFAFGFRIGGKFYVNGFDVRLSLYIGEDEYDYVAVKAFGKLNSDNTFTNKFLTRQTHYDAGSKWTAGTDISKLDDIFGGTNVLDISDDGLVTFECSACGLKIQFRQVNYDLSNVMDAGISVEIPAFVNDFNDPMESACFANCMAPSDIAFALGTSSSLDAMTYQVATHWRLNQAHVYADRGLCRNMQSIATGCPPENKPLAVSKCSFILTNPATAECVSGSDPNSSDAIAAYNHCFNVACNSGNPNAVCNAISSKLGSCTLPSNLACP